jgi:hypothetical protein
MTSPDAQMCRRARIRSNKDERLAPQGNIKVEECPMYEQVHPSDLDLIKTADGELPARRKLRIAAHLESCWSCRERMGSMESTIAEFVRARNSELNRQLDGQASRESGSRALLEARLAEASRSKLTKSIFPREVWKLAPATSIFFGVLAVIVAIVESTVSAEGPKPHAALTPGETRPITMAEICKRPDADVIAWVPPETRRKVLSEYGIRANSSNFEVDYLITPDLGGAESLRNLWPQSYSVVWNAHVKDRLEQRLHQLVCAGRLDLRTAQHDIATDWIGAYKKYVGPEASR